MFMRKGIYFTVAFCRFEIEMINKRNEWSHRETMNISES
jgi:hypothetical protein